MKIDHVLAGRASGKSQKLQVHAKRKWENKHSVESGRQEMPEEKLEI